MSARPSTLVLLLALVGCAGLPARSPAPEARPSAPAQPASPAPAASGEAEQPGQLPARTQRLFNEAVRAEAEQRKLKVPIDWSLLERKWEAVLDASEVPEARFNLGVALEAQGRLDEARAAYERARSDKPTLRQAAVNLAVLREREGDLRGAQAAYAEVLRGHPEDARSRERLAVMYRAAGQNDEAWRLAREALLRDPRAVGAYKVMAQVALARNQADLAKLIALRAQKLDPNDPELPYVVGRVLAKQGDEAGATVQLKKALALAPAYLPARHALLQGALNKQAWGQVAEHAKAYLEAEPSNAPVQLALGVALRQLDQPDAALAAYAKAQALSGDRLPEVHLARGVLLMRVKGECEPALNEFREFARLAGPVATTESPVLKLQRECEQTLAENQRAAEAARAMQAEAARKAADVAQKPVPAGGSQGGAAAPKEPGR